jgi:hypothetical protein
MSDPERARRLRLMQAQLALQSDAPPVSTADRVRANLARAQAEGLSPERQAQIDALDAQGMAEIEAAGRMSAPRAMLSGATQGATFGWADEILGGVAGIAGGVRGAFDPDGGVIQGAREGYTQGRDAVRAELGRAREERPVAAYGGELLGAVAVPVGAIGQGATLPARMGQAAGVGVRTGAIYGAGASEADSVGGVARDTAIGAAIGGVAGAAIPALQAQAARTLERMGFRRAVRQAGRAGPSTDDLRQQAGAIYDSARARGVEVRGDHFGQFADDIAARVVDEGLDPDITPRAAAALRRIAATREAGRDVSLRDLDILRRISGRAASSPDPNERRLAGMITEGLDDYMIRLSDPDLVAGNAQGLGDDLQRARDLWRQMRNSERIEQAIERARDSASGFENGIRVEFRGLLRNRNAQRFMNEGEREALRQVVRGTPIGNFLRVVSGFGGGRGAQRNLMLSTMGASAGGATGAAVGGPVGFMVGAAAPIIAGQVAARGSERITERAAASARNVMAGGGPALPIQAPVNALMRAMMPRLTVGSVPAGIQSVERFRSGR